MKRQTIIIISALLIALSCNLLKAQNKSMQLDSLFSYYNENGMFNGVVLATENGKIIYHKAFGFADFDKKKMLDTSSVFNIASTTKPFTALGIMMLKERGKLNYDDKLTKYFPQFPVYAQDITIRHLLNHTSGIIDFVNDMKMHYQFPELTTKLVFDSLLTQPALKFKPGTKYSYSNSNYFLLALIIEQVSGVSYKHFIEENIFKPLGMKNSYVYDETTKIIPNRVNGYVTFWQKDEGDLQVKVGGEGNIYTTAFDLFLFDQSLYTEKLIQQKTLHEAYDTTGLYSINKKGWKYGFGWQISNEMNNNIVFHPGGNAGFRCQLWRDLSKKNTLIILGNNTWLSSAPDIMNGAQNIMQVIDYKLGKISIVELFYENWYLKGFDVAIKKVKGAKAKFFDQYEFSEREINDVGMFFGFMRREPYYALEIFKLNTELFPEAWNTFDSLAETYLAIGNKELAIENFERSLKLNPQNTNAIEQIKRLREKQK